MNEDKIFDAIGKADDSFIEAAATSRLKKQRKFRHKKLVVAAAAVIVVGTGLYFPVSYLLGRDSTVVRDVKYPAALAYDDFDGKRAVENSAVVDKETIAATNEFAYKTAPNVFMQDNKNSNYSPLSLYYALSVTASGAEGNTKSELLSLLGFNDTGKLSDQCENLYKNLYFNNEIGSLKIANSIWLGKTYNNKPLNFKNSFTENAANKFFASSHSVDFGSSDAGSRMSKWIKTTTGGTLSPQIPTSPENILSIINTVYFHDQWTDEFDKKNTADDSFTLTGGSKTKTSFMNSKESGSFYNGENYVRSTLSFKNSTRMTFILPDEGVSAKDLISTPEKMKESFEGGEEKFGLVTWKIPKFSFNSEFDLSDSLKKAGINKAFSPDADFSGITDLKRTFVSSVVQGTKISIDEKGCEAASFTQIMFCGSAKPEANADMLLTRPFIYGIYSPQGSLLFVGICENPNEH